MSKLLVVCGATGSQGRAVLNYFTRHEPSYRVRGLTRNPSSPAAVALSKSGAEIVQADFNNAESLKSAFKGANAIFAYTDFLGLTSSPSVVAKFQSSENKTPLGKLATDVEIQHGKNIADAAAAISQLERLVWSTLPDVTKWTGGKYTHVYHFDSKAVVLEYMLALEGLKGKVSTVMMGVFASNITRMPEEFGVFKQPDGSIAWSMALPAETLLPWIDEEKDEGPLIKALLDAPDDTHVLGVSEFLPINQYVKLLSEQTGIKVVYQELSKGEATADDPAGFKLEMYETLKFIEEFGYTGGDPTVVQPEELAKKGIPIQQTKVIDYIRRADWSIFTK